MQQEDFTFDFLKKLDQQDITNDQGVIKYVNQNQMEIEEKPYQSCKCKIKYEGRLANGELIDQNRKYDQEVTVRLFVDNHIDGIHYALSSMNIGDKTWFKLAPQYHYFKDNFSKMDDQMFSNRITKDSDLYYKIELLSFTEPKTQLIVKEYQDVYNFYLQKKEEGNEFFQKKEYQVALQRYMKAISQHKCFSKKIKDSMTEEQTKQLNTLLGKIHTNIAQCEINLKLYKDALFSCQESDSFLKNDFKNKLRAGECNIFLGEYKAALQEFHLAYSVNNNDEYLNQRIKFCQEKLIKKVKNDKKIYSYAINKYQDDLEQEEKQKRKEIKIEKHLQKLNNEQNRQNDIKQDIIKEKEIMKNEQNLIQQLQDGFVENEQINQIIN